MKLKKQQVLIALLSALLVWSIVLNWLQSKQVDRLMQEMNQMEQLQSDITSHIEELEDVEYNDY